VSSHARSLIALLCIAAVLCALVVPGGAGLLWVVLVPLGLCLVSLTSSGARRKDEPCAAQPLSFLLPVSSRAPPVLPLV
jgi:hypothetical protein